MSARKIHVLSFTIFWVAFLSPYLWIWPRFESFIFDVPFLTQNYMHSFAQAITSTLLTLLMALSGALGLFWLESRISPRRYAIYEFAVILPSLLPALFLVVPLLNLVPAFPFGFPGVVIFHAISEVGIGALVIKRILQQRLSAYTDEAWLAGSSSGYFLRKTFPLYVADGLQLSMILLIYFLTSFSIPLLIGGDSYASLEVSIFEMIVSKRNWSAALSLFFYQFLCIGALLFLLSRVKMPATEVVEKKRLPILERPYGLLMISLPPVLILSGLLAHLNKGLEMLFVQTYVLEHWDAYALGALTVGFTTGGLVFLWLTVACYFLQFKKFRGFFSSFFTPSFVILAFAWALWPGKNISFIYIKISLALALAFGPTLLRFGLLQKILSLDEQMEMANHLGAGSLMVFRKITWPQSLPLISLMSGLAGVWAVGDFSLSRVVAGRDVNLAMWVQSLIEQYRWDIALVLSWSILLCALIVFSFFWGLAYVARQKLT